MAFQPGQNGIHVTLLQQLGNDLREEEFFNLKNLCKSKDFGGYGAGELEKIKSLSDLFSRLQQKRIFKEGNYVKLKHLLHQIGNDEAVDRVTEAEREMIAAGISVVGHPPLGAVAYPSAMPHPEYQFRYPSPAERMHPYNTPQSAMRPDQLGYGKPMPYERSDAMPSTTMHSSSGSVDYHNNQPLPSHGVMNININPLTANEGLLTGLGTYPPAGGHVQNFNTNQNQNPMQEEYYQEGQGFILFINNYFHNKQTMGGETYDFREGADIDFKTIMNLFPQVPQVPHQHIQHKLHTAEEVTGTIFWKTLEEVRNIINRWQYSFLMLILSSHGTQTPQQESIILTDSSQVTVDEIQEYFSGRNAPGLIGKPKVFIIQACRGDKAAGGVPDTADCPGPQTTVSQLSERLTRPDNADVLIAYSTSEGTKSFRNPVDGTWYIHHLCDAIRFNRNRNPKEHFLDLLLRVHRTIAARVAYSQERAKQMPCYMTTFTKKFVL